MINAAQVVIVTIDLSYDLFSDLLSLELSD
jgi:hypothetical protein